MKVVKRDGRLVNFNIVKIITAIEKAMKEVGYIDHKTSNKIAANVIMKIDNDISVEDIQDLVEQELMEHNKEVAKKYILYRNKRNEERQKKNKMYRDVKKIVIGEWKENANANVDEQSFGGRKNESAEVIQKEIALNELFSTEVSAAHRNGLIYEHDLGSAAVGNSNCLFVDFKNVWKNHGGFATRNGDCREPNSFSTACQLVAVIFQCQSQVQFGGVGSAHLDFDLAKYVKLSFIKHFKKGLKYIENFNEKQIQETLDKYDIYIDNEELKNTFTNAYKYAVDMLEEEGRQSAEALYHNLNTLESRAGE